MAGDTFEDEVMAMLDDMLYLLTSNEAALAAALDSVLAAALGQLPNITTTENVTVTVNNRPVTYNEVTIAFTERELLNAAGAALNALVDSDVVVNLVVDVVNMFADLDPWMNRIDAQDVREMLNEGIDELNTFPAMATDIYTIKIYLNPNNNAVTGVEIDLGFGMLFRGFFDFAHGYELLIHQEGDMTLKIHGTLTGNSRNFSGDLWFEFTETRWDWWSGEISTETFEGRLATFAVRYYSYTDYSIRIATQLGDIFAMVGENPHYFLPALFANYLNNTEISLTMEARGTASSIVFEIRETTANLGVRFEMTFEEQYQAVITAPNNLLSIDDIDLLLGRDLFLILGNLGEVIGQIEAMGFDASIIDMLMAELF